MAFAWNLELWRCAHGHLWDRSPTLLSFQWGNEQKQDKPQEVSPAFRITRNPFQIPNPRLTCQDVKSLQKNTLECLGVGKTWEKSGAFRDVGKVIMMPSYYHGDLRCTVDFTLNFGQHVSPLSLLEFELKFLRWFEIINIFKKSWTYSSSSFSSSFVIACFLTIIFQQSNHIPLVLFKHTYMSSCFLSQSKACCQVEGLVVQFR